MNIVDRHPLIEHILETYAQELGRDITAYRGHVYRVYNLARALCPRCNGETIAAAAVFHDLGIWTARTFDYLEPSINLAGQHLDGPMLEDVRPAIELHHKLTACPPEAGPLAEALRQADLIDLSMGAVRFGLPRKLVREILGIWPRAGFHRMLARKGVAWARQHPLRPLPMFRW